MRRTHNAVVQLVAGLGFLQDVIGRLIVGRLLKDRFMDLRVERLADRFDLLAIVLFEHGQ